MSREQQPFLHTHVLTQNLSHAMGWGQELFKSFVFGRGEVEGWVESVSSAVEGEVGPKQVDECPVAASVNGA